MTRRATSGPRLLLTRQFGAFTGIALVVGTVIGSGIFRVSSPIAGVAGNLTSITLVWILGGAIVLCGALSMAELAVMYPAAGGPYVYLREAYGRPIAFLYGWMVLLTTPAAGAADGLMFAEYLRVFMPLSVVAQHVAAAVLILLVGLANYRSAKLGAAVQNASATAKVLAIVGLALAIFILAPGRSVNPLVAESAGAPHWSGIALGILVVLWAYGGWDSITAVAGEIRQPHRNLPIALIGGVLVVVAIYLLVNAAYLRALPVAQVAASTSIAADAASRVLGRAGAALVGALVMLSIFGSLTSSTLSTPRVFYAMAEDGLFFRSVGRVHPRYATPYVAIMVISVITLAYVLVRNFTQLAEAYVLGVWPFQALCIAGLFVLRRKRPQCPRNYRAIGYPIAPALFVLAALAVIGDAAYTQRWSTLSSLLVVLAGIPAYLLWTVYQRRHGPTASPATEHATVAAHCGTKECNR